jgi:hypothetical protein
VLPGLGIDEIGSRSVCRARGFPQTSLADAAGPKAIFTGAEHVPAAPFVTI